MVSPCACPRFSTDCHNEQLATASAAAHGHRVSPPVPPPTPPSLVPSPFCVAPVQSTAACPGRGVRHATHTLWQVARASAFRTPVYTQQPVLRGQSHTRKRCAARAVQLSLADARWGPLCRNRAADCVSRRARCSIQSPTAAHKEAEAKQHKQGIGWRLQLWYTLDCYNYSTLSKVIAITVRAPQRVPAVCLPCACRVPAVCLPRVYCVSSVPTLPSLLLWRHRGHC
jgi:hypothetical protein